MPYIDSTPQDFPIKFEEDNLQDQFGELLTQNGWVLVRTFYKAAVDSAAYRQSGGAALVSNYAVAKHTIFKNADGKFLGFATVGQFYLPQSREGFNPVRRIDDELDNEDQNFGIVPSWKDWIKTRYYETSSKTNLYFYMVEKLPSRTLAPDGGLISIVTMPGMSGTSYDRIRDIDSNEWSQSYYYGGGISDTGATENDMEFEPSADASSPFHVIRSALDIEVLGTEVSHGDAGAILPVITKTDPRIMQSPIVKSTLRAEFLEKLDSPLYLTNWWTDSEIRIRGYLDSTTIFFILQADNAPAWEKNLVPTVPLYFGKINSLDGDKDEGYALFSGTIPSVRTIKSSSTNFSALQNDISDSTRDILVKDGRLLPEAPALLTIDEKEIVLMMEKDGNRLTVRRGVNKTDAMSHSEGSAVARLLEPNEETSNAKIVSSFDYDDPTSMVGEVIQPLLKMYPNHPSNGVDSVIVSRSRFGARYQAHYLSWNAPSNQLPPARMNDQGQKYPRAYEPFENTPNYKYQFNASRYSNKIHSSRIFVVHPEEGVRGYLDKAIGFNSQSVNASNLRLRKADCPEKIYEMYKYLSIGAVSPLTKIPATPFRPIGLGIYAEDFNPNAKPIDLENDATPPGEATITKAESPQSETIDITFDIPDDADFKGVNIYLDDTPYAKGVNNTTFFRIIGLDTKSTPTVKVTTVDMAGNESTGVTAPKVEVI